MKIGTDRFAQRQNSSGIRVAMMPIAQSFDRRLNDILRRREIRLADPKVDHIHATSRQYPSAAQNGKRIFFTDSIEI
jgi:hypothetical protein